MSARARSVRGSQSSRAGSPATPRARRRPAAPAQLRYRHAGLEALQAEASPVLVKLRHFARHRTFGNAVLDATREGDRAEVLLRKRSATAPFLSRLHQETTADEGRVT